MTFREVTVVVEVTERHTGTYAIDVADYQEWLDGEPDTTERLREYLKSGDDLEVIQAVYDDAERRGQVEIWDSVIEEVLA